MGIIKAICISEKRGTVKKTVDSARFIENFGIEGDAHAGNWHRQVSLLPAEKAEPLGAGAYGENLLVEGMDLKHIPVGSRLRCGSVVLEVTQIGKECHSHCDIYQRTGDCIMPREGVFAAVKGGGVLCPGDEIHLDK